MTQSLDGLYVKPEVLLSRYPVWDRAGNKMQQIRVRYCCGHEREWFSLDMGKGWKPLTKTQIIREELVGYVGHRVCQDCAKGDAS